MRYNRLRREYELKIIRATSWQEISRTKRLFLGTKYFVYQLKSGSQIVISDLKRGFSTTQQILEKCGRSPPFPHPDPYGPRLRDTYSRLSHLVNATLTGHHHNHHMSLILIGYQQTIQLVYNMNNLTVTYIEPFDFDTFVPKKFLGALRDLPTSQMDLQDDCLMLIGQRHVDILKDDFSEANKKSGFFSKNMMK